MTTTDGSPTAEDLPLLRRPPYGFLSMAGGPTPPRPRPVGERERWVSVAGRTTVEPDGAHDLVARHPGLDAAARADELAGDRVRVIHPEIVNRFTN